MEELSNPLVYIPQYFRVLTKADERGMSYLVPMVLWPSQEHYIQNRTHRDICVKNRQTGFSTGVDADNSHKLFTLPYQRQTIITHDQETSEFLFQTVQRFHHNLPLEKRPWTDWKSGRRMRFPAKRPDGHKGLDSYIYVDSAKSDNLGIGRTLNCAHLSEVAKWPPRKAEELFADISQTVPEGGFITLESTPKGRGGLFYRLYDAAKRGDINYRAFFYPWWWDITCVTDASDILKYTDEEKQLMEYVRRNDNMELSPKQIAFRRQKIKELQDLFFQEYPENDIDCWLSSEVSVFDGIAIRRYLQRVENGIQQGNLTIWKDVIGGERYVIGADPAGGYEKGDYSAATVLRVKTNEYVARIRGKLPPDLFAQEVLRLGYKYNDAEIGIERQMHGHTVLRVLMEANYPNLYHQMEYDDVLGRVAGQPGWNTTGKTKPIMIDTMAQALRANDIELWSENFLLEASGYMWEGQKTRKQPGGYDDELDALMIALQLRENAPIIEEKRYETISYAHL